MSSNPFITPFDGLPATLPVFPLPGAIVMPRAELPLNVFEPRYLNMVDDALASHRMIGMIQPDADDGDQPALCRSGCAGRITQYRETSDGRIEMVLTGVCRFDLAQEVSTTRGYRLVVPEWSRFADDYRDNERRLQPRHEALMAAVERYLAARQLEADLTMLRRLPPLRLVDSLAMALPFSQQEKQLLLECVDAETRLDTFLALIEGEFEMSDSVTRH